MKLTKLFFLPALFAGILALNSCSDKVDVNVVRKLGVVMDGNQVVPARPGAWTGTMDVEYNKDLRTLYYKVTWTGLSGNPTSVGVYGTAKRGFNPPATPYVALQNFTSGFIGNAASGNFSGSLFIDGYVLNESALYSGEYYIVVKTATGGNGEIRGQIEF